jgi:hypothetical protein
LGVPPALVEGPCLYADGKVLGIDGGLFVGGPCLVVPLTEFDAEDPADADVELVTAEPEGESTGDTDVAEPDGPATAPEPETEPETVTEPETGPETEIRPEPETGTGPETAAGEQAD